MSKAASTEKMTSAVLGMQPAKDTHSIRERNNSNGGFGNLETSQNIIIRWRREYELMVSQRCQSEYGVYAERYGSCHAGSQGVVIQM